MARIAVVYGTTEGQTAKVAQHIGDRVRICGHEVDVLHAADLPEGWTLEGYDAAIVGGSLHEGRHQRYLVRWIRENVP